MFINQPNGGLIYIPDPSNVPSGPWTLNDTKGLIAITIVLFLITLISIIIEWQFAKKRTTIGDYLKEVLSSGMSMTTSYMASMFTTMTVLLFYIVFFILVVGSGTYFIMGII
jgi:hypothetical protein